MGQPNRKQRPQYGWNAATLIDSVTLGEPGGLLDSETSAVLRMNGMLRGTVSARVEGGAGGSTGTYGIVLEGSNTGGADAAEWLEIASTNIGDSFTAPDASTQGRVLGLTNGANLGEGFLGEGNVSFGRWKYLRIRTVVFSGTPTFEMSVSLVGIGGDGTFDLDSTTLVRASGDTTEPEGSAIERPAGVRYVVGQVEVTSMIQVGGTDGFNFLLQAAVNQTAVDADQWVTLDVSGPYTATGDIDFFSNGQVRDIDLAAFQFFRVIGEKVDDGAPPGNNSSYRVVARISHDDNDWQDGEQGVNQLNDAVRQTFVTLVGGPVTGALPNRVVTVQICDMNMIPIRAVRRIGVLLADTEYGGAADLTAGASFTGATVGSIVFGTASNLAVIQTDATGIATLQIDTGGGSPVWLYAWTGFIPNSPVDNVFGPGQVVISSQRIAIAP